MKTIRVSSLKLLPEKKSLDEFQLETCSFDSIRTDVRNRRPTISFDLFERRDVRVQPELHLEKHRRNVKRNSIDREQNGPGERRLETLSASFDLKQFWISLFFFAKIETLFSSQKCSGLSEKRKCLDNLERKSQNFTLPNTVSPLVDSNEIESNIEVH